MNRTTFYMSILSLGLCLLAIPAAAGEIHNSDIGFSKRNLAPSHYVAGGAALEVYAESGVDVPALLSGLDLVKAMSPQALADRINSQRKKLYPDQEIILSITPQEKAGASGLEKASLVRAIYWWNNTNCSDCYWYAQYTSTTATLFVDAIAYGSYDISDKVGTNGSWILRYTLDAGDAGTRYMVGSKQLRGFRGDANGVTSRADVVMYFFK